MIVITSAVERPGDHLGILSEEVALLFSHLGPFPTDKREVFTEPCRDLKHTPEVCVVLADASAVEGYGADYEVLLVLSEDALGHHSGDTNCKLVDHLERVSNLVCMIEDHVGVFPHVGIREEGNRWSERQEPLVLCNVVNKVFLGLDLPELIHVVVVLELAVEKLILCKSALEFWCHLTELVSSFKNFLVKLIGNVEPPRLFWRGLAQLFLFQSQGDCVLLK